MLNRLLTALSASWLMRPTSLFSQRIRLITFYKFTPPRVNQTVLNDIHNLILFAIYHFHQFIHILHDFIHINDNIDVSSITRQLLLPIRPILRQTSIMQLCLQRHHVIIPKPRGRGEEFNKPRKRHHEHDIDEGGAMISQQNIGVSH